MALEHLDPPLGRAMALGDDDDAPASAEPGAHVGERLLGITPVGLGLTRADDAAVGLLGAVGGERRHGPPRDARSSRRRERISARPLYAAAPRSIGTAPPTAALDHEASRNSSTGTDQLGGPGAHPLGVADDDVGAGRQLVEQQRHLVDEQRGQGLHALDRDALGDACRACR